jgi:hypothetical protein
MFIFIAHHMPPNLLKDECIRKNYESKKFKNKERKERENWVDKIEKETAQIENAKKSGAYK